MVPHLGQSLRARIPELGQLADDRFVYVHSGRLHQDDDSVTATVNTPTASTLLARRAALGWIDGSAHRRASCIERPS